MENGRAMTIVVGVIMEKAVPATLPRLLEELELAWKTTDRLFGLMRPDAWLERPIALRHPFVFYLGHLSAFAWNQVGRGVLGRGPWKAEFEELFERGIDPPDERVAREQAIADWPNLAAIERYRDEIRNALRESWDDVGALASKHVLAEQHRIYALVLEHELMHHETLVYMLQALDSRFLICPQDFELELGPAASGGTVSIPQGRVTLGADFNKLAFGWDNEFPRQRVDVDAFELDRRSVTIGEYRAFVDAGGYRESSWWRADDWTWIQARDRRAPESWFQNAGDWRQRTMFSDVALERVEGWPVVVTCAEAEAYARWQGGRLPREAELQRAAYGTPQGRERSFPWGDDEAEPRHANLGLQSFDPVPAGSRVDGISAFGALDLVGNGWEWTSTRFGPLPGFEAWMSTYPGYSADFFDADHRVLFGAAWPTAARLARPSFRNWFRRRYPWVFATFRLVRA